LTAKLSPALSRGQFASPFTVGPRRMGQITSLFWGSRPFDAPKQRGLWIDSAPERQLSTSSYAGSSSSELLADGEELWMLVGLGNPGKRYEKTRHNVGFMLIDALAQEMGVEVNRLQENSAVARGRLCDQKVLLAKPMTFMNNSGESVGKLARFYR
jgi:hypothetical protein